MRCKSRKIQIQWSMRQFTPKLSLSTRRISSHTAQGSTISSLHSAVNLAVEREGSSCSRTKDTWLMRRLLMENVRTILSFVREIPCNASSLEFGCQWIMISLLNWFLIYCWNNITSGPCYHNLRIPLALLVQEVSIRPIRLHGTIM